MLTHDAVVAEALVTRQQLKARRCRKAAHVKEPMGHRDQSARGC